MLQKRYNFDTAAFIPPTKAAVTAFERVLKKEQSGVFANAFSSHRSGVDASEFIDMSKKDIALHFNISTRDMIFTSGATESNRVGLSKVCAQALKSNNQKKYEVLVAKGEHLSILSVLSELPNNFKVLQLDTNEYGVLTPDVVHRALSENTLLVCLSLVHSTTGIVQPVRKINNVIETFEKQNDMSIFRHCDAVQAPQYMHLNIPSLKADSVSLDGSKLGALLGVGLLYFKKSGVSPLRQSLYGTPKTALIAGLAKAVDEKTYIYQEHLRALQQELLGALAEAGVEFYLFKGLESKGVRPQDIEHFAPHILRVHFNNTNGAYLATLLDKYGFAVSVSSACMGEDPETSDVDFIRVSFDSKHTKGDVRKLAKAIVKSLPLAKRI